MKAHSILIRLLLLNRVITGQVVCQTEKTLARPPQPHVSQMTIDTQSLTVLHLRPGFVSSVRLPEEVSSVVLGDPQTFKAEHSEAEPRLVFLKPLTAL